MLTLTGDFPIDHPLTEWWDELTFDDALREWANADDGHLEPFIDRQRAVLDAFGDWAEETDSQRAGDARPRAPVAPAQVGQAETTRSLTKRLLYDPWVIALGSGLILVVVGVVLTIIFTD